MTRCEVSSQFSPRGDALLDPALREGGPGGVCFRDAHARLCAADFKKAQTWANFFLTGSGDGPMGTAYTAGKAR